ncbi:MAG: tRNA-dihydrouridine synthase family protein [Oscillospiraceae bacterium]|nr:tRNA-dihydrouridine synthase family protein [Oscillospiraceae bacterium]
MEGVTGAAFRRVHRRLFPEADRYYAPFLAPDAQGRCKQSHWRALLPEANPGLPLVPQILTNSASAFLAAARALAELGYAELNLNAGCPSGTVVSKRKGVGMLGDPASLDAFLDKVFQQLPCAVSVKTRLGLHSTAEFPALLEVYRRYPLAELIVHARDREGMYRSACDHAAFAASLEDAPWPVCYNGDVFSVSDLESLRAEFPNLGRVMLGRGAVRDPALFRELRGGAPLGREELCAFHDALLEELLAEGLPPVYAPARMKELWYYWTCLFPGADKQLKALKKSRDLPAYRSAASVIFTSADFDPFSLFLSS